MTNARKILDKKLEKKPRDIRKRRGHYDISSLPDAIVDGKLIVPLKGQLIFERTLDKRVAIHNGYVFSIDEDGVLTIWDETRAQFYAINVNQPHPMVKIAG